MTLTPLHSDRRNGHTTYVVHPVPVDFGHDSHALIERNQLLPLLIAGVLSWALMLGLIVLLWNGLQALARVLGIGGN
jgi:hypothetical protein